MTPASDPDPNFNPNSDANSARRGHLDARLLSGVHPDRGSHALTWTDGVDRGEPRIIPVLDLLGGRVVRAVAGRRAEYQPLQTSLVASDDPLAIAAALIDAVAADTLYVADLDRILGHERRPADYHDWAEQLGVTIWADCGGWCHPSPRVRSIQSTEWVRSPVEVHQQIVSLDLRNGEFVGEPRLWGMADASDWPGFFRYTATAAALIILDVASVGTGDGGRTRELCELARRHSPAKLVTGGGLRHAADIRALPVDAVLVATAIHTGQLRRRPPTHRAHPAP